MAKVRDVIFCLRATNMQGQGACATSILTALTPEYIPGLFTFSVIITLVDIDSTQEHRLIVDLLDPSGESVVHVESTTPCMEDNSNLPQIYKGMSAVMDWNNVNLKQSGEYLIKITVDGDCVKETTIYVKGKNE